MSDDVSLQQLIDKVREDLLSPSQAPDYPLFFVEKVELELRVNVEVESTGGIKLSVLNLAGIEMGAKGGQAQGHTIKIVLTPILSQAEQVELLKQDRHLWDGVQDATRSALRKSSQSLIGSEE